MADSVREKIIKNIVTTLQAVVPPAYTTTIRKVERIKTVGLNIQEFPTILIIPADETKTQEPLDKYTTKFGIILECWIRNQGDISVEVNTLLADVEKALMTDYTRGGVAVDTKLVSNSAFYNEVNKPYGGIEIRIEIHYRHKYNDPYTAG